MHVKVSSLALKTLPGKALQKCLHTYYTTSKSFTGVILRQTDADQAHFNPQAIPSGGGIHPYACLHRTLAAGVHLDTFRAKICSGGPNH